MTQEALARWWSSAARLAISETGYQVEDLTFQDGVCRARLDSGVLVPVRSGTGAVDPEVVGLIWVGEGALELDFPHRGDARAFANHLATRGEPVTPELRAVAAGEQPLRTRIDRALLLSADPKVKRLLLDLEPTGSGVLYTETDEEGVDAVFVVTEHRRSLTTRVVASNLLPGRRRLLLEAGLDPVAMVRQDRLQAEVFGVPPETLRLVAEFRTDTPFRAATARGKTVGSDTADRWLTCFRDGSGQHDLGFRTLAFAHGEDQDGRRHFVRVSGEPFDAPAPGEAPSAPLAMEPVAADVLFEAEPRQRNTVQAVTVDSTLTLRPRGGPLQYVALRVPAGRALPGSWKLDALELADGTPLPWVSLSADLQTRTFAVGALDDEAAETSVAEVQDVGVDEAWDPTTPDGGEEAEPEDTLDLSAEAFEESDHALVSHTERRLEIITILPEPVPEGEPVEIRFAWSARWQYANWSWEGQYLGPTTGLQPLLPEILPTLGGTPWSFHVRASIPGLGFRRRDLAVSGDTVRAWEAVEGTGRQWVESEGTGRDVSIALGQWYDHAEPPAESLPAVRVHLFPKDSWALGQFPPEVRRVVAFLQRFLPAFPQGEVEVFQGPATFADTAVVRGFRETAAGLVAVRTIRINQVGESSRIRERDPHLMQTQVARQVAHQYWGQHLPPATARERWFTRGLADAYAAFYVRAGLGRQAWETRMEAVRKRLEDPTVRRETRGLLNEANRGLSLTGATPLSDLSDELLADYGFYVLAQVLRRHIGDRAFFMALDRLATEFGGRRLTQELVESAFEATSGEVLDDFFDYWVDGGFIPSVELEVHRSPQPEGGVHLVGCVTGDVPFGRFHVPVRVVDRDGERVAEARIPVADGAGSFELYDLEGEIEVTLDPEHRILARHRRVRWVDEPPCSPPASPR